MAAFTIVPAPAAGNTVVLKPAERTPLTALILGRPGGTSPNIVFADADFAVAVPGSVRQHRALNRFVRSSRSPDSPQSNKGVRQ
jgi:acyl-CoA reductase-like NAD-dependent aldehyde dehydrogenase